MQPRQVPVQVIQSPAAPVAVVTQQHDHCDCHHSHTLIGKLLHNHHHKHHHNHHHTPQVIGVVPVQQPIQTPVYAQPVTVIAAEPVHHHHYHGHHRGR